ncbi:hypothetical protein ACIGKM_18460 [Ectopseudomonas toyotomiensis]|uniref:hypothetical protein n=1 Tax=Ectopseudomonas toyotomiensis TaxID=554344 RepID=UPI0037C63EC3
MTYEITSRGYLGRAIKQLSTGTQESLFYAAFELRCGIEARMRQYLSVWEHVSKKKKNGWQISALDQTIEQAFRTGNKYVRWAVHSKETGKIKTCIYHTPVTKALKESGEKLGNHLHALKSFKPEDDEWWDKFKDELIFCARGLRTANLGTMIGPALKNTKTNQIQMNLEIPPNWATNKIFDAIQGQEMIVHISYPDALPLEIEPEAILWNIPDC